MRYIETLKEGDRVSEVYLCKTKTYAKTKAGKDFASVVLIDKTGQLDGKIWDLMSGGISEFEAGEYVEVSGQVLMYNGSMQFRIERARVATGGNFNPADYIPSSRFDIEQMYSELLEYIGSVRNAHLSALLKDFFVEDKELVAKFKTLSAAKSVHHSFAGGLLEHTLSVTRLCDKIAMNYDYLNRDLLISAAMLHDIGKIRELTEFPKNDYTDEGNLIGHIVMGYEMIMSKSKTIEGFPELLAQELGHCVLAHHGELEYGSPKKPAIAEALALSMVDNIDAKLETIREALDVNDTNDWVGFNRWLDSNIRRT